MVNCARRIGCFLLLALFVLVLGTSAQTNSPTKNPPLKPTNPPKTRTKTSNTKAAQSSSVKAIDKQKCDAVPTVPPYTELVAVAWTYEIVASKCLATAKDAATCSDPSSYSAVAVSTDGHVKTACPVITSPLIGQFGIDVSDGFKATSLVVKRGDDAMPHEFAVNNRATYPRTQVVSANFADMIPLLKSPCARSQPCSGYIQNADGSETEPSTLHSVSDSSATIEYKSTENFKPTSFLVSFTDINGKEQSRAFPFSLVAPQVVSTENFTGSDLDIVSTGACGDPKSGKIDVKPSPADAAVSVNAIGIAKGVLIARVTAPSGYVPNFVIVSVGDKSLCSGLVARRSTSPPVDELVPNITFTLVDQETVRRDFGERIERNYFAAMVEVHNPTAKKLQLNKSALWFDVDYVEAYSRSRPGFIKRYLGLASDLNINDAIIPQDAHVFRYGIDHTQRHYPHNFAQILGSYDATVSAKNRKVQGYEVVGSLLSSIAISVPNDGLNAAAHLFAGVLVPGAKQIFLNPDEENRKRSNLVSQALQNFVQIPPFGSASTLAFLPRKSILAVVDRGESPAFLQNRKFVTCGDEDRKETLSADVSKRERRGETLGYFPGMSWPAICDKEPFAGAEGEIKLIEPEATRRLVPVVIKKVLEVQWDKEVISQVNEEVVAKGVVKLGMTKEQVRQALGEPETVTSNSDKTSCFLYREGKFSKVCFDPAGLSNTWEERTLAAQVQAAGNYNKIREILLGGAPLEPAEKRDLVDGSFVWFNAPQINANLRFDSKGTLLDPDYKEKFDQLKSYVGKSKKDFETALPDLALDRTTKQKITDAITKATGNPGVYPSPDLQGENIDVTFKAAAAGATKKIGPDWIVDKIDRTLRKQ